MLYVHQGLWRTFYYRLARGRPRELGHRLTTVCTHNSRLMCVDIYTLSNTYPPSSHDGQNEEIIYLIQLLVNQRQVQNVWSGLSIWKRLCCYEYCNPLPMVSFPDSAFLFGNNIKGPLTLISSGSVWYAHVSKLVYGKVFHKKKITRAWLYF